MTKDHTKAALEQAGGILGRLWWLAHLCSQFVAVAIFVSAFGHFFGFHDDGIEMGIGAIGWSVCSFGIYRVGLWLVLGDRPAHSTRRDSPRKSKWRISPWFGLGLLLVTAGASVMFLFRPSPTIEVGPSAPLPTSEAQWSSPSVRRTAPALPSGDPPFAKPGTRRGPAFLWVSSDRSSALLLEGANDNEALCHQIEETIRRGACERFNGTWPIPDLLGHYALIGPRVGVFGFVRDRADPIRYCINQIEYWKALHRRSGWPGYEDYKCQLLGAEVRRDPRYETWQAEVKFTDGTDAYVVVPSWPDAQARACNVAQVMQRSPQVAQASCRHLRFNERPRQGAHVELRIQGTTHAEFLGSLARAMSMCRESAAQTLGARCRVLSVSW